MEEGGRLAGRGIKRQTALLEPIFSCPIFGFRYTEILHDREEYLSV